MANEAKNVFGRMSSLVTVAIDRYSASADDLETVVCFFVFHEIGDLPSVIKYPFSNRRVRG